MYQYGVKPNFVGLLGFVAKEGFVKLCHSSAHLHLPVRFPAAGILLLRNLRPFLVFFIPVVPSF